MFLATIFIWGDEGVNLIEMSWCLLCDFFQKKKIQYLCINEIFSSIKLREN